jgi:uncharacterized protein (TIGR02922 family)
MNKTNLRIVTIIYYSEISLELLHQTKAFKQNAQGRVILTEEFKKGKSIIAVCEGEIEILNKLGDRITMFEETDKLKYNQSTGKTEIEASDNSPDTNG